MQFAGRLWPVTVVLMVTVFCGFLYSWPLQSLLPTYPRTEPHYDPGQVSNALLYAGTGYAAGSVLVCLAGDRFGTRRAYVGMLLLSLLFVIPVFAVGGSHIVALWVLLFCLQGTGQGASGVLPKYVSGHFPVGFRAAALGFTYNVGALGGAAAPVLGAKLAEPLSLGTAIAVLALSLTAVVILLIGFDVPARVHSWADARRPALPSRAVLNSRTGLETGP
ncbi:MFS transporter [Actinacidiphila oryziradicis]|uniref:MFS transporter n=1 Tax=Actinacidiphila oryziradicis TaxID=2571141 RepID=UPI001FEB23BD|nr:MFS transporter [Actinacidiphila oryziradicis]